MNPFAPYLPIAEAISRLFFPHVEVVLHNLETGCIEAIYNPFSKRSVGDHSWLDEEKENFPKTFPVYSKTGWNGKKIKSITAPLHTPRGKIFGLLCINLDLSKWEETLRWLLEWMQTEVTDAPDALFREDWKERIHTYVSLYLQNEKCSLNSLNKIQKKNLVLSLKKEGAFSVKHAASYIAEILSISRATVYNYLKDVD